MTHEFPGHCPSETIAPLVADNPEIAEASRMAQEQENPGICAGFVLSQTVFSGDRPLCLIKNDCILGK